MASRSLVLSLACATAVAAPSAYGQLWQSVDILTKAHVRVQVEVSPERNCLTTFKLSISGREIYVPKDAVAGVCDVLLEDIKAVPDETSINENIVASGYSLLLTTLPSAKPDEIIDDHRYVRYEFGFDDHCLRMRRIIRWDSSKQKEIVKPSGAWSCS